MIKLPDFSDETASDTPAQTPVEPVLDGGSDSSGTAPTCAPDRLFCPICSAPGFERKQKWYCSRCGQLLMTCCD